MSQDLFLTRIQKKHFENYSNKEPDHSFSSVIFSRYWDFVVSLIPVDVAPNVLSIAGLICNLQAFYLCFMYMDIHPRIVCAAALFLTFAYQTLDSIDGRHAIRTGNNSSLGELFAKSCSNVGVVFMPLTLCFVLGIEELSLLWYTVQIAQLLVLRIHVKAFKQGYVSFSFFNGPNEGVLLFQAIILIRFIFGLEWLAYLTDLCNGLESVVIFAYYSLFIYSIIQTISLPFSSRNGMAVCLMYRAIPAALFWLGLSSQKTLLDIICDGLFMSILTTDMIVAKMAKRDLHPWVVIFAMASLFSNFLTLTMVAFYYCFLLYEISSALNLPLFSTFVNVYCDGIYDMCHIGHMKAFENALRFGTRLIVGVCSDEDATPYKRKPIMNTQERCDSVKACRYVHKVVPGAPCNGLTEEFLRDHQIHLVACGEEYERPDDKYYGVPRRLGMTRILPRYQGLSTSELIRRITQHHDKELAEKQRQKTNNEPEPEATAPCPVFSP
eukprot:TRINITY_DN15861_c0_g1_i1.p1 TRINITY_DN15861_c0_g1~~TRINITY_DN15861_c0_g1_i1.p1  ORF type:complete len:495 (+),score=67.58 TRINITY_DN15861_c0_g1_i1:183-1667(+)